MLSSVLTSEVAIQANVQIMRALAAMRRFLVSNAQVFQRLENLEYKLIATDQKVEKLYDNCSLTSPVTTLSMRKLTSSRSTRRTTGSLSSTIMSTTSGHRSKTSARSGLLSL